MKSTHRILVLSAFVAALAFAPLARADEPANDRSTEFQAVEGRSEEEVSGFGMMVGAYGLIGLFLFAYVARIGSLQARTSAELERLAKELGEGDGTR